MEEAKKEPEQKKTEVEKVRSFNRDLVKFFKNNTSPGTETIHYMLWLS